MRWIASYPGSFGIAVTALFLLGWGVAGFPGLDISPALALGLVFTVALSAGLTALAFYSDRSGTGEIVSRLNS